MTRRLRTLSVAIVLGSFTPALQAQQTPPEQMEEWRAELQRIRTQLQPLQNEALQDEAVRSEQEDVMGVVREAIVESDPTMGEKLDRMESIMAEAQAAQAERDQETLQELTAEAQTLQPQITEAQQEALGKPDVMERVDAFREKLYARMLEIDPESEPLINRMKLLDQRIRGETSG
jgi:chromosome segregation ATPase